MLRFNMLLLLLLSTIAHSAGQIVYTGTAQVIIDTYDFCGVGFTRSFLFSQTLTQGVQVYLNNPIVGSDGQQEQNPFNLVAVSSGANTLEQGSFVLVRYSTWNSFSLAFLTVVQQVSGWSFPTSSGDIFGDLVVRYWQLSFDGVNLQGTLIEDGKEIAGVWNQLGSSQLLVNCRPEFGSYPNIFTMQEGTILVGQVNQNSISFTVQGRTFDTLRDFRIDVQASVLNLDVGAVDGFEIARCIGWNNGTLVNCSGTAFWYCSIC
jgi:hypothetical protein